MPNISPQHGPILFMANATVCLSLLLLYIGKQNTPFVNLSGDFGHV